MRPVYLLVLAAVLAGCAIPGYAGPRDASRQTSARQTSPRSPETLAMDARADSLLGVVPDSLSMEQAAWLQAYQSSRYAEATAEDQRRNRLTMTSIGVGLTAVALLILYGIDL